MLKPTININKPDHFLPSQGLKKQQFIKKSIKSSSDFG